MELNQNIDGFIKAPKALGLPTQKMYCIYITPYKSNAKFSNVNGANSTLGKNRYFKL